MIPEQLELTQRAIAALQRGAWSEAADLASTALQRFGPEANALMVLASVRTQAGDAAGAIDLYERARALMPTHVHVLVNLAAAYRQAGRLAEARQALAVVLEVEPHFAIAHHNLGNVLSDLQERGAAQGCYEQAAELDPHYGDPLAALARIAEEEHRLEDAQALAARALQLAPRDVLAALILARARLRLDDSAGARLVLEGLLQERALSPTNRVVALGYLGEAFDKLGDYPRAFAAFSQANALQYGQHATALAQAHGPLTPYGIEQLTSFMASAAPAAWRQAPPGMDVPVFMVGFPRSGTTLLDQVLASHPEVTTLEERDTLLEVAGELLNPSDALTHWAELPDVEIERLRGLYWERVRQGLAGAPRRPVFIDKQPLNAVLLPLIYRIFPTAKIILSLRDPRDVLLSCYQQRFGMNAAMFQLLRLDTATEYYTAVMGLVELSCARLPLQLHRVKYEDLVGEFEPTVRGALSFLGLPWDDGVRRHTATARTRSIGTPSAAQVVRPLYGSARGRWRNYAAFLEPYLPRLSPWIRRYGYREP